MQYQTSSPAELGPRSLLTRSGPISLSLRATHLSQQPARSPSLGKARQALFFGRRDAEASGVGFFDPITSELSTDDHAPKER